MHVGTELHERITREVGGAIESANDKDYFSYQHTLLNDMTRMATVLGRSDMEPLVVPAP